MRKVPKKGFKVELTKVGGMHIFEVARFIIDPEKKTTRCLLIEDHRIGKTSILRRTLAKSKVTCKDPDVYNEETGKLMAFTEAIDQYHLKQMRSAER